MKRVTAPNNVYPLSWRVTFSFEYLALLLNTEAAARMNSGRAFLAAAKPMEVKCKLFLQSLFF